MAETIAAPNNRAVVFRGRAQREKAMPWTGSEFASRHNHSLDKGEAKGAARQASAMVKAGVPDGIAIATANKRVNKLRKRGVISDKAHARHTAKYGGEQIDASSR